MLLEPCDVENGVDGLLLCAFDECAGVYNDAVSLSFLGSELIACLHNVVKHDLGVAKILCTAERNKADLEILSVH